MKASRLAIPDVVLLEPTVFEDERGCFFESFNQQVFERLTGVKVSFVQDNHSISNKGVLRGMHFQIAPHAQGKLVRVVRGAVYDVAVDIREGSPTYRQWVGEYLSADNRRQLWIPEGFAHGFLALEQQTEFLYKTTDYYDKASERHLRWNDPDLGIAWPLEGEPMLSAKDMA